MNLFQRILYYAGGFAAGLVILLFFLGGKKASCDYTPNARVLKNIRIKKRIIVSDAKATLQQHNLDTAAISHLLQKGDVDFDKSNTKSNICKTYWIDGEFVEKKLSLHIKNCDSTATVQEIVVKSAN